MNPTPEQIKQALKNSKLSPRTHGAKVRDALIHVSQSGRWLREDKRKSP